jgi:hypothetical protein
VKRTWRYCTKVNRKRINNTNSFLALVEVTERKFDFDTKWIRFIKLNVCHGVVMKIPVQYPRLLILGLDGLEYKLVYRWKLENLLQDFHGIFQVGDISRLYTPLIWSSILCGFNVEHAGYTYEKAIRKSMGKLGLLHEIKKIIFGEKQRMWIMRKMLRKLGLLQPPEFIMPEKLLMQTFLKQFEKFGVKVFAIEIPGYNEKTNGVFRNQMPELATHGNWREKKRFLKNIMQEAKERFAKTKDNLENYDLLMTYIPLPDLAHHLFFKGFKSRIELMTLYKWLETKTKEVLISAQKLNFKTLIISDHGFDMKKYYHSLYGFWSANFQIEMEDFTEVKKCLYALYKIFIEENAEKK